ncbi:MAG: class I SAM-dependent methyltransferase [Proteobacteria bacterium]|nr:MAG: class I SAM-dependent methyltransferase [Pseudomonadota bacterium]
MHPAELKAIFDQQAAGYDTRWARTAPIRNALHFLLDAVFAGLPEDARILCVGAGTGEEINALATRHPMWTFTAVEPSGAMLAVCRSKADAGGYLSRCSFHEGYLATLPDPAPFDAATCFLVSQFITDRSARVDFFRSMADRLRPGGLLACADIAADTESTAYTALLTTWHNMLLAAGVPSSGVEQMREAYRRDVAVLPPAQVATIIADGGFDDPVLFHQAGLIHAWCARRG